MNKPKTHSLPKTQNKYKNMEKIQKLETSYNLNIFQNCTK